MCSGAEVLTYRMHNWRLVAYPKDSLGEACSQAKYRQ